MYIDSHAHLGYPDFEGGLEEVISRAKGAKVNKIINVGTTVENSKRSLLLSKKYKDIIFTTAGLHPHDMDEAIGFDHQLNGIKELIEKNDIVAVGECGLDYSRILERTGTPDNYEARKQRELFISQLELAHIKKLPIIVHSRMAEEDTFDILSRAENIKLDGVVHCYTGTQKFAKRVLDLGFYIGFTGIITFPKADEIRKVVKSTPLDRILIETDCPFIAPVPFRGQRNEPAFVMEVANTIAEIKGIKVEEVAKVTSLNAENLFKI